LIRLGLPASATAFSILAPSSCRRAAKISFAGFVCLKTTIFTDDPRRRPALEPLIVSLKRLKAPGF
jgi:hypothetical protein